MGAHYREHVRWLAGQPLMARSFERLDVDRLHTTATDTSLRAEILRASKHARHRTSDRALPRFTRQSESGRRIVEEPPLITRLPDDEAEQLTEALDEYLTSLPTHWRRVLSGYTVVDVAHKVVGVGSVGLRAYVVLCEGSSADDVVFLQLKQARRSVLARYVHGESAWHAHQGQRVVEYQQELQTVSDPLLGWTTVGGRQYYVRQFRNMKAPSRSMPWTPTRSPITPGSAGGSWPRACPDQRGLDDRRLPGFLGQGRPGPVPVRSRLRGSDRTGPSEPGRRGRSGADADRTRSVSEPPPARLKITSWGPGPGPFAAQKAGVISDLGESPGE